LKQINFLCLNYLIFIIDGDSGGGGGGASNGMEH